MAVVGSASFVSTADFTGLLAAAAKATKSLEALRLKAAQTGEALGVIGRAGGSGLAVPVREAQAATGAFQTAAVEANKLAVSVTRLAGATRGTAQSMEAMVVATSANTRALAANTTALLSTGAASKTVGNDFGLLAGKTGAANESLRLLGKNSTIAGAGIRNGIGGAAIAGAAALVYLSAKSTLAASNLVEQQNKANRVFGESVSLVKQFATSSAASFGGRSTLLAGPG